jgi:hypothetical protein
MADHEEAVQEAECGCRNGKEIHRRNHFSMVSQKAQQDQPELARISLTARPSQVPRDRALRNLKAQFQ